MLTYTFSKREKIMLAILGVLLIAIGWFELVYVNTTDQIRTIEQQIETTNSNITLEQTKLAKKKEMERVIEQRKAEGAKATPIPEYDNIRPLMAELNNVMSKAENYTLSFDALDTESTEYVLRGVGMEFGCSSYAAAEEIIALIADGPYPCIIDAVNISDAGATNVRSNGSNVKAKIHVIFYEKPTEQ
ncbi:MAG: hypothetical protein Q4C09_01635 [Atopobiaceae bacterium]|nr:hypothetical protein [Atopobiaceae bacterium]